jgi:hypothetical protein
MSNIDCNHLRKILKYQQDTGLFFWKIAPSGRLAGQLAGSKDRQGYIRIKINNIKYAAHRLAWMYVHGNFPNNFIDHINGIKDDNRICNIRDVTRSENMQNINKPQGNNIYLGVYKVGKNEKYRSKIGINGRQIHLGYFSSVEEAKNSYVQAKKTYHITAPHLTVS